MARCKCSRHLVISNEHVLEARTDEEVALFLNFAKANNQHVSMYHFHPQFIKDASGKETLIVLPAVEYMRLIEELEDMEDVCAYDKAKA